MRIPKTMYVVLAVTLLVSLLPLTVVARPAAEGAVIEDALLEALAAEGTANFFVDMAVQADLSAAFDIADWNARGEYVWNALNEVAAATQAPVIAYAEKNGLEYASMLTGNSVFIRGGTLAEAEGLAAIPGVAGLRLEQILFIPDPFDGGAGINGTVSAEGVAPDATIDWGILDTKADQAWVLGARGQGIKVANIDTGAQWNHPALVDGWACPGDGSDPACWEDPSNICGGTACDNNGHGTHTMGTMVAQDDESFPYIAGMAPDATWIACKGCESSSCSEFALNTCADWILAPDGDPANRPHVVNNSWGGGGGDNWYQGKVQAWQAAGVFPAFSAGNSSGCGSLGSPGDYQESFGTTGHTSSRGHIYAQGPSAFGHDPYTKPNITAPATSICSTVPTNNWSCGYSGTSMASPHTAGTVAQVWSVCPEYIGNMSGTFEILQDNADPPDPPNPACGAPPDGEGTYEDGYGYLNTLQSVMACIGGVDFGTVEGYVHDDQGNPLEGASVQATPATEGAGIEAITDPNGFYSMELLPGFYDVTATKTGYSTETVFGVEVVALEVTEVDFILEWLGAWQPGTPTGFDWYRFDGVFNPVDGLAYFLGGREGGTHDKSIWTYDPATGVSTDTGVDMLYNSANTTINFIADDGTGRGEAMYVLGGYDVAVGQNINNVQRYYPQSGIVEELISDPYPERASNGLPFGAGGSGVVDGKVYYFGGWDSAVPEFTDTTWMFDPMAPDGQRWTNLNCPMGATRAYIDVAVSDGLIYAMGGDTEYPGDLVPTDLVEVFDPANPGACWTQLASLPAPTSQGRGFGFDDDTKNELGKLYVVGGGDWPDASADVYEYDIATDTWSDFADLSGYRRNHAGVTVTGCTEDPTDPFPSMWVFGGWIGADAPPFGDPEWFPLPCGEPPENTMHVFGIEGYFSMDYLGRPVLRMHVGVEDQDNNPLSDVLVTAWMWVPDGGPFERSRYTKPSGNARFHWGSRASGTWSICAQDLVLDGYTYVPDDNVVTCMDWNY